jgi:4-oxalocrotonate tautomerase
MPMPDVIVRMYPGRSEQLKARLAGAIVKDVMAISNVGEDAVSFRIEEVKPDDWAEKVYKPDIVNGPGKHYN